MIELRVEGGPSAALALSRIKQTAWDHPGNQQLVVVVPALSKPEPVRLALGPAWRYSGSPQCLAALSEFGEVTSDGEPAASGEGVED